MDTVQLPRAFFLCTPQLRLRAPCARRSRGYVQAQTEWCCSARSFGTQNKDGCASDRSCFDPYAHICLHAAVSFEFIVNGTPAHARHIDRAKVYPVVPFVSHCETRIQRRIWSLSVGTSVLGASLDISAATASGFRPDAPLSLRF